MPNLSDRFAGLDLDAEMIRAMEAVLPQMAERTVAAVTAEVPSYADAFSGRMGRNIENAVQMSLGVFLRVSTRARDADPRPQLAAALEGAYDLGRGEARSGRSIDALLSAYRVGARVAWRELSATAVAAGLSATSVARFAEMVFAFIDELSAASVSGHADEIATTGRVRERYLERLARDLLCGEPLERLQEGAVNAHWPPPMTLTAVLLPIAETRGAALQLRQGTLILTEDLPAVEPAESLAVLLVPGSSTGGSRRQLVLALAGRHAVVGPARPWSSVGSSYRRAVRARALVENSSVEGATVIDTEEHLVELILGADSDAAQDLRRRALAPLAGLRAATADRLVETLRSWVLHLGHREAVAAELFVHPQTVRYRMTQLRQLYGDRLDDPNVILELVVALGVRGAIGPGR